MAANIEQQIAAIDKQIAAIDSAMASGVRSIEAPDAATVTYRDYGDMRLARADLYARKVALAATTGAPIIRRTRQIVTTSRSGW